MKNNDDIFLRSMLKENLPEHLPSPWFTRKVMNRLPERRIRIVARVEYAVYILALIATVVFGVVTTLNVVRSGIVKVEDLIVYFGIIAMASALCWMLFAPFVERMKKNG